MIKIELGAEVRPGVWEYRVPSLTLEGRSSQPLLDACREIKRISAATAAAEIGLYRAGRQTPDIRCRLDAGAGLTVSDPSKGRIGFVRYRELDVALLRESPFLSVDPRQERQVEQHSSKWSLKVRPRLSNTLPGP